MANKISGIDGRPVQVGGGAPVAASRDSTSGDRKTETTSATSSNINVSDAARTLAALEGLISTPPAVNEKRVDAVRRAMADGRYPVDPQRVAATMMRFEVDLL